MKKSSKGTTPPGLEQVQIVSRAINEETRGLYQDFTKVKSSSRGFYVDDSVKRVSKVGKHEVVLRTKKESQEFNAWLGRDCPILESEKYQAQMARQKKAAKKAASCWLDLE